MTRWSVLLVDADRLFCAALGALLDGTEFHIIREEASLASALAVVSNGLRPDLILVDVHPKGPETLLQLRQLRSATDARLVILASDMSPASVSMALQVGLDGHLNKSMSSEALRRSLHLVMLGEAVFPAHIATLLSGGSGEMPTPAPSGALASDLSKREIEILRCLLAGQSNKTIARNLCITESTVKMHFKNVMRKIRAQNRTQAAVWAIQNGLSPRVNL